MSRARRGRAMGGRDTQTRGPNPLSNRAYVIDLVPEVLWEPPREPAFRDAFIAAMQAQMEHAAKWMARLGGVAEPDDTDCFDGHDDKVDEAGADE